MNKIIDSKIKIIKQAKGSIRKLFKYNDIGYMGFGEMYISECKYGEIKGWKKHKEMTCNLILLEGKIKLVICKNHPDTKSKSNFIVHNLTKKNPVRITIPPNYWFGFQGISKENNSLINFSNIIHSDKEVETLDVNKIKYNWMKIL